MAKIGPRELALRAMGEANFAAGTKKGTAQKAVPSGKMKLSKVAPRGGGEVGRTQDVVSPPTARKPPRSRAPS